MHLVVARSRKEYSMNKKDKLRKLLEDSSSNYTFSNYLVNVHIAIKDSHSQMRNYFATNDEEKALVDIMFEIIWKVYKKEKIDFSKYTSKQLFGVLELTNREQNSGCYTYDLGILWYGYSQYEEILKIVEDMRVKSMSPKDILIEMLLNGNILNKLKADFSEIKLEDKNEYMSYISTYYKEYSSNVFAKLGNYKLEIICTGILDPLSIENKMYTHLAINKYLGFRLINMKTGNILKVNSYSDIKRILSR